MVSPFRHFGRSMSGRVYEHTRARVYILYKREEANCCENDVTLRNQY